MILNIDTALSYCSAGLGLNGKCVDSIESDEAMKASEVLHGMIDELVRRNNISLADLKAVAVNGGPGSYTGLRIGASAAKGFCYALDIPLIHLDGLLLIARHGMKILPDNNFDFYIPVIDARRNEIFCTVYDKDLKEISQPGPMILNENSFNEYAGSKVLFLGDATAKVKSILNHTQGFDFRNSRADIMDCCYMSNEKYLKEQFVDFINYSPNYLKKFFFMGNKMQSN